MEATIKEQATAIAELTKRVYKLEQEQFRMHGIFAVKDRVSELLLARVSKLEQYTRRYSVVVRGIPRPQQRETSESLRTEVDQLVVAAGGDVTPNDIDKCHRNGPRKDDQQEVIIRFRSHTAKETFYRNRKKIQNVKVQPSLTPENKSLLEEARNVVEEEIHKESFRNPPEFVYANIHGNLEVKMREPTRGSMFHRFSSLVNLYEIFYKCNSTNNAGEVDERGNPERLPEGNNVINN